MCFILSLIKEEERELTCFLVLIWNKNGVNVFCCVLDNYNKITLFNQIYKYFTKIN